MTKLNQEVHALSLDQGAWSSVGDPQSWRPVSSRNHWEFGIASTKESQIFRSIPCEWLLLQHSSENLGHLVWVVWFSRWRFGITAASKLTLLLGNVVQTVALKPCNHQDTFALPEPRRCRWTRYKKLYKDDQRWSNTSNPQNADHLQQFSHDTFPIDRPCNLISRTIPALAQCSDDFSRSCHTSRAIPRLPCTDLCRSLVGNAKRATLSNKGACHMMQKNMSVLSNHRSPKRFVPDLIWATSSPCARITDALPATSKYLVKATGPVGQDNPGWLKIEAPDVTKTWNLMQLAGMTVFPKLQLSPYSMMHSPGA